MKSDNHKSKILDWLSSLVNHSFEHHFSDKWISVDIWDNIVSISLDLRQPNQLELFNKLPKENKGCLQKGTGKLVNEQTLYFKLSDICEIEYPTIVSHKLIKRNEHQESEKGGWYIVGSYWYSYDWELTLSDNTTIQYNNQKNKMDLKESSRIFKNIIQEREFFKFIDSLPPLTPKISHDG